MIIEKINLESIEDAIVKLDISTSSDLDALIDYSAVKNVLNKAHYLVSINKNISEPTRNRIDNIEENYLSPLKALELYFQSRELSEDKIEELLKHAIEIIEQHSDQSNQ